MQPWENVKRQRRHRRAAILTTLAVTGIVILIVALSQPPRKRSDQPAQNNSATRNDKRRADLADLGKALSAYQANHTLPARLIGETPAEICTAASPSCKSAQLLDLGFLVTSNTGLASIPKDPIGGPGAYGSGYTVMRGSDGAFVFAAPRAEGSKITYSTK